MAGDRAPIRQRGPRLEAIVGQRCPFDHPHLEEDSPGPLEIVVPVKETGVSDEPKVRLARVDPRLSVAEQLNQAAAGAAEM